MIHKFRAWDEETEEMLYSDKDYERCTFVCESEGTLKCYVPEEVPATNDEPAHTIGREIFPIMQYTGLKDKNGKKEIEIYAGDKIIISDGDSEAIGRVIMSGETGQWVCEVIEKEDACLTVYVGKAIPLWEVLNKQYRWKGCWVGNIHQHPELLEK